jgi:hypothetical protein
MTLPAIVEKYRQLTPGFGTALPLADFGLTRDETERTFGIFDEDYHISRFFHFSKAAGQSFQISGFAQTHISIDAEIQEIL